MQRGEQQRVLGRDALGDRDAAHLVDVALAHEEVGLAVVGAERAALGPELAHERQERLAGCARSRPRGSGSRRPCAASRAPPRRSSTRDPSGCRPRGRRRGGVRARPGAWPSACVAPRSVSLRSSSGSPAMTAGKFIISATPSACRRRSTDSRSPIESGRRGDSKRLAGTHDDAITQTSSGTSSQTSSSQWMPSVPSTFAISCGIGDDARSCRARAPRGRTRRPSASTTRCARARR